MPVQPTSTAAASYTSAPVARKVERADGPATVLAIGTANPPNVFEQSTYPDFYFNITNSNHMTGLKEKFQRICGKSGIKKRCMYLNEEILKANPSLCASSEMSLDVRQDILVAEVPKLGAEAASEAIKEWGQPKSRITHLVFSTNSGIDMPGADWVLTKLLGLRPSVKRLMIYQQGCFGGGTVLRAAKDLAENNKGARVLVVCSEIMACVFRGPSSGSYHDSQLVVQALFGDGAAAMLVGSDPIPQEERPWFEIHYAASDILPDSGGAIRGHVRQVGLMIHLMREVPTIVSESIDSILKDALEKVFGEDVPSYNDMFWIAHPGGRAILDQIEQKLQLKPEKLASSRQVLSDFGNMTSACVLFVMDHMRKKSVEQTLATTGEGHEWGFLLGFGPGITCETVVLRSVALSAYENMKILSLQVA